MSGNATPPGRPHFFVFADNVAPTFELSDRTPLVIHPDGLEFGFVLRATVRDNSFGTMSFRKHFEDLRDQTIRTREDGTPFIRLEFQIMDLAGNTTDVMLELILDPNAPLVQGTGQRDLPARSLPTTLYELLEYYLITGQTDKLQLVLAGAPGVGHSL